MHKRWIRRSLPVLVFTFIIVLYLDFQFRSLPKHNLVHDPSPDAFPICRLTAMDAQNPACNSSRNRGHPASEDGHVTQTKLKLEDIFVAVKTTGRFHKTRLALLLETWISRTKAHTFIFTDTEDEDLRSDGHNIVVTGCQSDHTAAGSACKMSAEYDGFMASDK
ncbi:beta-1,3-N-acetylglucosaminyltransferase manic fringe-like, partial [Micropterus salmoides]|uniref:beta-1,3-N-acetylglucosaminyltransferase manic fringe-like n=1 Tax=Micropterus salmoides TaxID=27706 RepID=UPI0018ED7E6E